MRNSSPVTAAGPSRIYTGFPFKLPTGAPQVCFGFVTEAEEDVKGHAPHAETLGAKGTVNRGGRALFRGAFPGNRPQTVRGWKFNNPS